MKTWILVVVGVLGLALGMSCDGSSLTDGRGTGGSGGVGGGSGGVGGGSGGVGGNADAGCKSLRYFSPGCDVSPICTNGTGGDCYSLACGCSGKIIQGCGEYAEPYAYTVPVSFDGGGSAGMTCDPTADAGL
jgi:hypothetical protein